MGRYPARGAGAFRAARPGMFGFPATSLVFSLDLSGEASVSTGVIFEGFDPGSE